MPIPPQLLQHFRAPSNKREMPDATAKGAVEGMREGQWLTLYLRLEKGRVADASFTNTGDRQADASLSILTELVPGLTVPQLEALDWPDLARPLGVADTPGVVTPALDVLAATLAALRGEPSPFVNEGRLVCHCFHVREGRIRRAVREHGLRSVDQVTRWTRACGGCRSCRPDIGLIIEQERM